VLGVQPADPACADQSDVERFGWHIWYLLILFGTFAHSALACGSMVLYLYRVWFFTPCWA
jgi:hypothetical protein